MTSEARAQRKAQIAEHDAVMALRPAPTVDLKKYAVTKYATAWGAQHEEVKPRKKPLPKPHRRMRPNERTANRLRVLITRTIRARKGIPSAVTQVEVKAA